MVVQFWASTKFKYFHCCTTLYLHQSTRSLFKATVENKHFSPTVLQKKNLLLVKESPYCNKGGYMKYWREKDALFKVACKYLGHQVLIRKAFGGKELTKINTIADAYRIWIWKLTTSSSVNSKDHSKGWHYRSIQKLVLCLNIARNKGQVLMSLPILFWSMALEDQVYSMPGSHIKDNNSMPNLQSLIDVAVECLLMVFRALYLLLLFAPSIVIAIFADESNIQIRSFWLGIVLKTIENAGPAFIKWGQWAATRPDIFPSDICNELSKLHFEAPAHSFAETQKIVNKAFGLPIQDIFEEFSDKPVASGSIAQVYRAVLKKEMSQEGEAITVAVKVRHPHVRKMVARDFKIIKFLAKTSMIMPGLKHLQLDKTVHHFATYMTKQTWKNIVFPEPIYPFVHPEILVETFEEGHSIIQCTHETSNSHLRSYLAALGTRLFLKMLLVDNFIHGDLHPGNIFVRSDGVHPQIVVLDVGMAIELSQRSRSLLFELFKAASFRDGKTVAKCTLELSREQSCSNKNQFIRDVDEKFKKYLSVRGSAKNTGECMTDLFDEVRRHHVNIDGDVCTVMVTSLVHEGWQRKLDPELDILDILHKQLAKDEYSKLFRNFMMGVVAL
ncbi:uncharacterized protein LOC131052343 isoform X2 [Cryptomeria japonica]|uniref:uncharacterized protein LOC131052343 isoform X2 n=1 Tax=Cryptomeria japonica TaxID=3369 RepID=UPI0027DA667B|nr:uncharacterized protein LOC131052343 isoform X2 [Cryptomeria japonica]